MTYNEAAWHAEVDNGHIPRNKLAPISPTQHDPDLAGPAVMHPEAAAAMSSLLDHARADGVPELGVTFSYRTFAKQVEKWEDFQNGGNLAAVPGTSNHGWGVAVDMHGLMVRGLGWLRNNAGRFGYHETVPGEVWHWEYHGGWTDPGEDEDVNLDKYIEGGDKYRDRYKKRAAEGKADPDPGPPPDDMNDRYAKAGWNDARFAGAWPR